MYIVWGTKTYQRPAGMAADFCGICRRATGVMLYEVFSQSHVYYVGLGKGKLVGRFCRCMDCASEWALLPGTIQRTLDP